MLFNEVGSTSNKFRTKENRLNISKEMFKFLRNVQRTHFHNLNTGDESCFLFEYVQGFHCILSKEDLITKTRNVKEF